MVWGEYPQQPGPDAKVQRRAGRLSRAAVERLVAAAAAVPPLPPSEIQRRLESLRRLAPESEERLRHAFTLASGALAAALGFAPYRQQLLAACLLLDNRLVEMATGEGKTAAIALAAAVAALQRTPVHVVTANDYLAQRDAGQLRPFFESLGLRVGCVTQSLTAAERRAAHACEITYCTAKELAFDYLRDNQPRAADLSALEQRARRSGGAQQQAPVLRGLCMAIIDEADTVLIDEARLPLVLSRGERAGAEQEFHREAMAHAVSLAEGTHFVRGGAQPHVELTAAGLQRLEHWPAAAHPLYGHRAHRQEAIELALAALWILQRDHDYVVRDGQVLLIDETTGRAAPGRAWSRGLHQMVELKEGVAASATSATVAQLTFQRFFPRYLRLAGTSGTLAEARRELQRVYGLQVVTLAPRMPKRVRREPARYFPRSADLWEAVAQRAAAVQAAGGAVLVGTDSVAHSEALSAVLAARGLAHQVLNARQDQQEGALIAAAGQPGRVTVATSMAGRGADILLGPEVLKCGGLHVILCQHNASARIDRQFLGRAGRQGQPGSTRTMLALDFPLLERWSPAGWLAILRLLGCPRLLCSGTAKVAQSLESFTRKKQRVTLLRHSQSEERELTFSREGIP